MSRRVAINLTVFVGVFVVMIWWAINNIVTLDFIERPYQLEAEFAATVGVTSGSEVTYLGVHVGDVRGVESVPGGVVITMDIERGKQIPAGAPARIFRKSAVGEPYIDFEAPADFVEGMPVYEPGDVIPQANTTVPLEFSELLRSASNVIGAVDPEATRTLVHELALALNGRSDDLRALTVSSDALLETFASRSELLDRLSANNTQLTRTITEHRGSLTSAVGDLADLAQALAESDADTRVILDRGVELLGTTADLVEDVKDDLDCVLHDLDDITQLAAEPENRENLAAILQRGPTGLGFVYAASEEEDDGLWIRVQLIVSIGGEPADQYIPPTELPAVPTVPPCVSTLDVTTASIDDATIAAVGPGRPIASGARLPGASNPLAALLLVAGAGLVAAVGARRRTS